MGRNIHDEDQVVKDKAYKHLGKVLKKIEETHALLKERPEPTKGGPKDD